MSHRRDAILAAATDRFGQDSYEHTKWADIAGDVGVGATALYHYFESKQHCLFVIMEQAVHSAHVRFEDLTSREGDAAEILVDVLYDGYDLTEREVLRNRLLVAEQGLLANRRTSPREEEARQSARARTRDLEFAWGTFLARGMEQGSIPKYDARLLTNAILGLHNSVWHWYRPGGTRSLEEVADFYVARLLAMVGLPAELAVRRDLSALRSAAS